MAIRVWAGMLLFGLLVGGGIVAIYPNLGSQDEMVGYIEEHTGFQFGATRGTVKYYRPVEGCVVGMMPLFESDVHQFSKAGSPLVSSGRNLPVFRAFRDIVEFNEPQASIALPTLDRKYQYLTCGKDGIEWCLAYDSKSKLMLFIFSTADYSGDWAPSN